MSPTASYSSGRARRISIIVPSSLPNARRARHNHGMADTFELSKFPVHLGLGATVAPLEEFDGTPDWYERYGTAHAADGAEARLVSMHTFNESWSTWEMHPDGHELVVCTSGRVTLHQELAGGEHKTVTTAATERKRPVVLPIG